MLYFLALFSLVILAAAAYLAAYNLTLSRLILRRMTFEERLLAFFILAATAVASMLAVAYLFGYL